MTTLDIGPPQVDLLRVRAGDRNLINVTLTENGEPIDLTDLTIEAQARHKPHDEDPALTAVITVLDAEAGTIEIRWPGDDVRTLLGEENTWKGVWDLQIQSGDSDPQTLMAGKFTAEVDVTR